MPLRIVINKNERWHKSMKKLFYLSVIVLGICLCSNVALAANLGEETIFNVDSVYDSASRTKLTATLRVMGGTVYFYVDNEFWSKLSGEKKSLFRQALNDLAQEFDQTIYPKERAVFGSEWNPGIDNDSRITVLVSQLTGGAGGYVNIYDNYPKKDFAASNEREMVYLNGLHILNEKAVLNEKAKAFLAHEFQHLITFYQKTVLFGEEEDVWLNEARSEYAPTVCGYDSNYSVSNLADRVAVFLTSPSDSLTEWKNNMPDYGSVSLFMQYLVGRFGKDVLTRMVLNEKTGIASVNQALADLGSDKTFSDVFADWSLANYLNDCKMEPKNNYCYLNQDLTYQRLHVDYSASYSGFPNLIVSRSSAVKDWSPYWYRFRQDSSLSKLTDRDTLKLEFNGFTSRGDFFVPYLIFDSLGKITEMGNLSLINQQGILYVPNFTSQTKSLVIAPFNQYKKSGFSAAEQATSFSFTALSVASNPLSISAVSPSSGPVSGGYEITVKGSNFSSVKEIIFAGNKIADFKIIDSQTIAFKTPSHLAGPVNLSLTSGSGETVALNNAFVYSGFVSRPEGSLLRARGDAKVYVIKGNYKRWIQTADIFTHYGHLKWSDIIEVEPAELENYQESWLIRADGNKKVYQITSVGAKQWLNMSGPQFGSSGRQWDSVFVVNTYERDAYKTGKNITK